MLLKEATRKSTGESLLRYKTNITNAVNQLISIKSQLTSLKTNVNTDAIGAQEYYAPDDVVDVQSVIDLIDTEVAKI